MKCEVCDEEFDTENELLQHKAKMHAGGHSEMPGREAPGAEMPEDLEEDVVDAGAQMIEVPAPVLADGDAGIESLLERSRRRERQSRQPAEPE